MHKLVWIELKKILKKRSVFLIMIMMLLFNVLNNVLFYTDYDEDGNYKYQEEIDLENEKQKIEEQLNKYDYTKLSDVSIYINLKTKLDMISLKERYKVNSWQYNKVDEYLYNTLENINIYTFKIKNEELLDKYKLELNNLLKYFDSGDWRYFVNLQIVELEKENKELKSQLDLELTLDDEERIKLLIENNEQDLRILKYRIVNNVSYDLSYLNVTLNDCYDKGNALENYSIVDQLNYQEIKDYQKLKSQFEINKYVLKNKINYNKQNNLNYQLRTIVEDYEIFILIIILLVASSSVSEEFVSGTIKSLLIKPYSRGKILLSKYLALLIILLGVIVYLILLQIIVGGIIFGFTSLDIPVLVYSFKCNAIIEYNVFIYMLIRIIAKIPLLVMILTISFSISTVIINMSLAITLPLFLYIFTPSIGTILLEFNDLFKYFVGFHWNFNNYLFGGVGNIDGMLFRDSLIIWISYYVVILIFTYFNFKKKNIKNI